MNFCKSASLISLIVLSTCNVHAEPAKAADEKSFFAMILDLENSIPFKKTVVEKLTDCRLKLKYSSRDLKEYDSDVSNTNLVANVWLKEATPPDEFAKGILIVYLNKTKSIITEDAVRKAFGKPNRIDDALNSDISEAGQPKSLIYNKKWGLLIFDVDKAPEHHLKKVCIQASVSPPL
jgi:hypothetical protein